MKRDLEPPAGYYNDILETIGATPMVRLTRVAPRRDMALLAKLEFFNPGTSVKDRIALRMIADAERDGKLKPGGTIVECTSGNTGAGVAMVAAVKGYKVILSIPDKTSPEKIDHAKALGAEVLVTPSDVPSDSPYSYYAVAQRIAAETPNSLLLDQYNNLSNFAAHYETTGPEIWAQTNGKIDYFVAGMSTGGTISGVAKYLKEQNPAVKVIGVDTVGSALAGLFKNEPSEQKPYKVEGVGKESKPGALFFEYIDDAISVSDKDAFNTARLLARREGILAGGSSGLALHAALQVARKIPPDKTMAVLIPDAGVKYLSKQYSDAWMLDNGFMESGAMTVEQLLGLKSAKALDALIYAKPDEPLRDALEKMLNNNISQMPVLDDGKNVGALEENMVMQQALKDGDLLNRTARDAMGARFPTVHSSDSVEKARSLFAARRLSAALVHDSTQTEIIGIITKSDLLEALR